MHVFRVGREQLATLWEAIVTNTFSTFQRNYGKLQWVAFGKGFSYGMQMSNDGCVDDSHPRKDLR